MKASSFVALLLLVIASSLAPAANAQTEETGSRKVVNRVMPAYPAIARHLNLSGSVKLEAVVAANGSVKSVQVLGGNPVLAQSAESAVRAWKWEKGEHETTEVVEVRFDP
jgi:TonB family protein